jgi:hypothetical protein
MSEAVTAKDIRAWAIEKGYEVGARGRLSVAVIEAYNESRA